MRNSNPSAPSKSIEGLILASGPVAGRQTAVSERANDGFLLVADRHNRLPGRNLAFERNEAHRRIVDNGSAHAKNKSAGPAVTLNSLPVRKIVGREAIMATAVAAEKKTVRKERVPKAL